MTSGNRARWQPAVAVHRVPLGSWLFPESLHERDSIGTFRKYGETRFSLQKPGTIAQNNPLEVMPAYNLTPVDGCLRLLNLPPTIRPNMVAVMRSFVVRCWPSAHLE